MKHFSARTLLTLAIAILPGCASVGFDTVTYRGETIPLSKRYVDFHEYRDDPNNLRPDVLPRVAQLVREAPISRTYPSREAAQEALYQLMFPGYGYSVLVLDKPVALYALEIPGASEDRSLTYAPGSGGWLLIDYFVWPAASGAISSVEVNAGHIRYYDKKGTEVLAH